MSLKNNNIFYIEPPVSQLQRPVSSYTVDEAIEVIGMGKLQIWGVAASILCLMNYILDVLGLGLIIPAATCDLQMDTYRKGLLTSVPFLGLTLTSHLWGFLADSIGRRKSVCLSLFSSLLCSSLASIAPNYWLMLLLRLFSGMGFSGSISATYPYMREILPKKYRSHMLSLFGFAAGLGMILGASVGYFLKEHGATILISENYSLSPWRIQMLVLLIPGAIGLFIYTYLPESPKFLMSQGESEKAIEALRAIHQTNCNKRENFPIKALVNEYSISGRSTSFISFLKAYKDETTILLGKPYRWPLLGCCLIQYGVFTVGASFVLWYPELTNKLGEFSTGSKGVCDIFTAPRTLQIHPTNSTISHWDDCSIQVQDKMFLDNMFIGIGYLIANTFYSLFNIKFNLLYIWIISVAVSSLSAFTLPSLTNELAILIFFSLFLIGSGASINIFNVIVVQIFPTHLCGMALSLTLLTGRLATFIGANGLGILLESHCEIAIYGVAALVTLSTICGFYLPKKVIGD